MENKRRKNHTDLECVQTGFANGVAPGFPLTEEQKTQLAEAISELKTSIAEKDIEKVRNGTGKLALVAQTITQGIYSQGAEGQTADPEVSDVDFEEVKPS